MFVSVVVHAHNRRQFLHHALRSLERQSVGRSRFEVVVVKNFEDPVSDGIIKRNGWRDVYINARRYGEAISAGVEEARGDVIAFLEDDDEFEEDKLSFVLEVFTKYRKVSYVHDTRKYIDEYGKPISVKDPRYSPIINGLESITPHVDVVVDPDRIDHVRYLLRYYGLTATVSLMAIRAECLRPWLGILRRIEISVEGFIPAVASTCGYLYHTARRLTRYRIHSLNSSIAFDEAGTLRVLYNLRRAINDHRLILDQVVKGSNYSYVIRQFLLGAKYGFSTSKSKYRNKIFNDVTIRPREMMELCLLRRSCIGGVCGGLDDYVRASLCMLYWLYRVIGLPSLSLRL